LAIALKGQIEGAFLGAFDVFVSSDPESLPSGVEWRDTVYRALRGCNAMVALCSVESVRRPWLNFETGVGWTRKIPVIPLCHSGCDIGDLPSSLSAFQSVVSLSPDALRRLFTRLSEIYEMQTPEPNFEQLSHGLSQYEMAGYLESILIQIGGVSEKISTEIQKAQTVEICNVDKVPKNEYDAAVGYLQKLKVAGFLDFASEDQAILIRSRSEEEQAENDRKPLSESESFIFVRFRFKPNQLLLDELQKMREN